MGGEAAGFLHQNMHISQIEGEKLRVLSQNWEGVPWGEDSCPPPLYFIYLLKITEGRTVFPCKLLYVLNLCIGIQEGIVLGK